MTVSNKIFHLIGFAIISLLISSCTTLTSDITTQSHAAANVNFDAYRTYSWAGSAQVVFDPVGQWEQPTVDTDEEFKLNIDTELREHGLSKIDTHPDLLVVYVAGIDMTHLQLIEDPDAKQKILKTAPKSALVIALIDANTGYTVWMGIAEGDAQTQQTIENIRARIKYAVHEIFKSYND